MPILRNASGQKLVVFAFNSSGTPITGDAANITAQIAKDGGASAALSDTNPTELDSTDQPGLYLFDLTQAETNAALIVVTPSSVTSGVLLDPVSLYTAVADGAGTGARTVTLTVNDGSTVLEAARVRVTQGTESYVQSTNASGVVTFNLDDATWTVAISKAGYSFAGASLVVNGTETQTYSMTSVVITPGDPDTTTAYITVRDNAGVVVSGATVQLKVTKFANGTTGSGIDNPLVSGTTDVNGYVEFPGLPRLASYHVRIGEGKWFTGTTLDADTTPLAAALGVAE